MMNDYILLLSSINLEALKEILGLGLSQRMSDKRSFLTILPDVSMTINKQVLDTTSQPLFHLPFSCFIFSSRLLPRTDQRPHPPMLSWGPLLVPQPKVVVAEGKGIWGIFRGGLKWYKQIPWPWGPGGGACESLGWRGGGVEGIPPGQSDTLSSPPSPAHTPTIAFTVQAWLIKCHPPANLLLVERSWNWNLLTFCMSTGVCVSHTYCVHPLLTAQFLQKTFLCWQIKTNLGTGKEMFYSKEWLQQGRGDDCSHHEILIKK